MAERTFQDGDTVMLKSGGPIMTVLFYREDLEQYACAWFVTEKGSQKRQDAMFPEAALQNVDPESGIRLQRG